MNVSEFLTLMDYHHTQYDGAFIFSGNVPTPEVLQGIDTLCSLIGSDDFLTVDLDGEQYWDLDALCGPGSMDIVKTRQCALIREARRALYEAESDHLGWEASADGLPDLVKRNAWLAKRDEIKARIPWPGVYR